MIKPQGVYHSCIRNELASLKLRHLLSNGEPQEEEYKRCLTYVDNLLQHLGQTPKLTPAQVIEHKKDPGSRRRYLRAFSHIKTRGLDSGFTKIKAFVKIEKWDESLLTKKAPRLIQFRSYEYCALLSQFLIPIEQKLWSYEENGINVFAKGLSTLTIAKVIVRMSELWDDTIFVMADHSKFDSCILSKWIKLEEKMYMNCAMDEELEWLMQQQQQNRGLTRNGIRYRCVARKMSGEYNTSLGDSVINYCILKDVFRNVEHHIFVNGDDSVIAVRKSQLHKIDLTEQQWLKYGMKTTYEITDDVEQVEFCQCKPVMIRQGVYRMVRKPDRVMSRGIVAVKRYQGIAWNRLVKSIGMSEMACHDGIPVLQAFAEHLMRAAGDVKHINSEISMHARNERTLNPLHKKITDEARNSFYRAFDIPPSKQISMEQWLDANDNCILPTKPLMGKRIHIPDTADQVFEEALQPPSTFRG